MVKNKEQIMPEEPAELKKPTEVPVEEQIEDESEDVMEAIMVKLQEIEGRLAKMEANTVPTEEPSEFTEELKPGKQLNSEEPERETGEVKKKMPEPTVVTTSEPNKPVDSIPQTNQPAVGTPPGEDLQDKMKVAPQTNAVDDEDEKKKKEQVDEDDKKKDEQVDDEEKKKDEMTDEDEEKKKEELMGEVTAGGADDPTKPKPGDNNKDPNAMDGAKTQKLSVEEKVYQELTKELVTEKKTEDMHKSLFSRQTQVGTSMKESNGEQNVEFKESKGRVNNSVKEYLTKKGQLNLI